MLSDSFPGWISTNHLAADLDMRPGSIRVRLCNTGSFHGIKPRKLPSGRLLWPGDSVERLLDAKSKQSAA